jgi:2-polyprenyl-3-methyl-5-hydroxy-6-metoxy-1,4-benzoquinol methylase
MEDNNGWNKIDFLNFENLDKYAWHKGYFQYKWDPKIWKRNFREIQLRDISLFTFGDLLGKNILDIGCGEGLYMLTFLKMGASYVAGQDISSGLVEKAISICNENGFNCDAKVGDGTKLNFDNKKFDFVFSGDVFEHITDKQKKQFIAEIFRVLKPGGLVTIKTPNLKYLRLSVILKRLFAIFKFQNPF